MGIEMKNIRPTVCVAALAASLMIGAAPAFAQDAAQATTPQADADDGDIIVTAQKREENVQRVPLAVSVLTGNQLQAQNIRQFQDLARVSPSLTVRPAEHPVNANVSLRGVGTFAFGIGVEPSVAVLVDEVPLAFQARAFTDLPDVERIEVLRGPQSTLYGKSASAGLINIITRQPTDTFRIRANANATTDSEYGANFSVSGPMGENLGYVVSASYSTWDGNVRNLFNGQTVNGNETFTTRGRLRWEPSDTATITLSLNYLNGNTDVGRPFIRMSSNALLRGVAGQAAAVTMPGVTVSTSNQDISNNFPARTKYSGGGGSVRAEFDLGGPTLLSITSYDRFRLDDFLDQDDTASTNANGSNIQVGAFNSRLFTQELRLVSPGDGPFRYTLGAYYGNVSFNRPFFRGPAFSLADWYATAKSQQVAGFAQFDWEVVPSLTLTAGGRVQYEKVEYSFQDNRAAVGSQFFSGNTDDTAGTWRVSGRYEITPDIGVFATYSTGYKGQTYDLTTGFNAARAAAGPIRPERSRDIELGIRTQFFDRHLTLNATYFDTSYTNLQAQTIETLSDGSTVFRLTNVGKLATRGLEVDAGLRFGSDFNLGASVALLDATYTDFPIAQCYPTQSAAQGCTGSPTRQNLTGTRAIQAPEFKVSLSGEYAPMISNNLRAIGQFNLQNQSSVQYTPRDPQTFQPAYTIVNVGLGIREADRRWEVVAYVNNLFDQQYFPALVNSAGNFGLNAGNPGQATQALLPRDFRRYGGIRASINF
jgi:iron complex outermembrane receptor protein